MRKSVITAKAFQSFRNALISRDCFPSMADENAESQLFRGLRRGREVSYRGIDYFARFSRRLLGCPYGAKGAIIRLSQGVGL